MSRPEGTLESMKVFVFIGFAFGPRMTFNGAAGRLDLESGIMELAGLLRRPHGPLPSKAVTDRIHWAVASAYGCDYILTWNFKHLNNASIKRSAERIIREYGYESPTLCSPEELERELGGADA